MRIERHCEVRNRNDDSSLGSVGDGGERARAALLDVLRVVRRERDVTELREAPAVRARARVASATRAAIRPI